MLCGMSEHALAPWDYQPHIFYELSQEQLLLLTNMQCEIWRQLPKVKTNVRCAQMNCILDCGIHAMHEMNIESPAQFAGDLLHATQEFWQHLIHQQQDTADPLSQISYILIYAALKLLSQEQVNINSFSAWEQERLAVGEVLKKSRDPASMPRNTQFAKRMKADYREATGEDKKRLGVFRFLDYYESNDWFRGIPPSHYLSSRHIPYLLQEDKKKRNKPSVQPPAAKKTNSYVESSSDTEPLHLKWLSSDSE